MHFAMMAVIPVYVYPEIGVLTNWFKKITEKQKIDQLDIIWTSAGYDSTLRLFPMLEILEIYIRYLPLENSLLNRKKSGMETEKHQFFIFIFYNIT